MSRACETHPCRMLPEVREGRTLVISREADEVDHLAERHRLVRIGEPLGHKADGHVLLDR